MVGSAGNAPVRRFRHIFCDARFTVEQPDHFPKIGPPAEAEAGLPIKPSTFAEAMVDSLRPSRCAKGEG